MALRKRVLLVINCARDASYANRHVLSEIYSEQFDAVAFAISQSCVPDRNFRNVVQSWDYSSLSNLCPCGDRTLGDHCTYFHSFHPRLIDVAEIMDDFGYVVFAEDDCLISPNIHSASVASMCKDKDVILSPIEFCPPDDETWVWTRHSTGYAAFDQVASQFDCQRLLSNWERYGGTGIESASCQTPMFKAFVDWTILEKDFLQSLVGDLAHLNEVWHEAAMPTAILHNTHRIGVSNGLALWGGQRAQTLRELIEPLRERDFVHPVKPSLYLPDELICQYEALCD